MPGVTEEMLARVMSADVEGLRRRGAAIAELLTAGAEARITDANGSDLRLGLGEREGIPDAGDLSAPGAFGNLPCGEGFIAPIEGTGEGKLVSTGRSRRSAASPSPVELTVEAGHLVGATGAEGERLMELLTAHGEGGTNVAELGIGTNETARSSRATCSRTRRSSAAATSRSAPRPRSAAPSRCRSTSTASC